MHLIVTFGSGTLMAHYDSKWVGGFLGYERSALLTLLGEKSRYWTQVKRVYVSCWNSFVPYRACLS